MLINFPILLSNNGACAGHAGVLEQELTNFEVEKSTHGLFEYHQYNALKLDGLHLLFSG